MKKSTNRFIRICTPVLCLLLLLPSFCLWAVAEEAQLTENGMSWQALESAEALDLQRAELVSDLDEESLIFNYVDRASFIEAGHVERVCEDEEPNTYVFKNADGSKTVYFLDEDVKYVNAGGEATEKKLDLVALDGGYTTRASNVSLALPNAIASGVTLAYNGNSVTLTPKPRTLTGGTVTMSAGSALTADGTASAGMGTGVGMTADLEAALMEQALQIAPVGIASGKADYQGAFGTGTTLRYTPTLSGVKEDVILDAYRGQNTFAFTLNTGNLSVFEEEGRYFIAPTADAEEKILISDTWVYDSAGNFEKGTLSVVQVKNGLYLLTVGASVEFLTDENTVYPVYIDPTLEVKSGTDYIEDVTVFEGIPNINCGTFLYNTVGASSSYGRGRTAIRLTGLINGETWQKLSQLDILSAEFCIYEASGTAPATILVYPLESDSWTESGATWNNIGDYDDTKSYGTASLDNSELASFNITGLVTQHWKGGSSGLWTVEQGFILVSENETTPIKQFYSSEYSDSDVRPYVSIRYKPLFKIKTDDSVAIVGKETPFYIDFSTVSVSNYSIVWRSKKPEIATVDSNGLLIPLRSGTAKVEATITYEDGLSYTVSKDIDCKYDGIYRIKNTASQKYLAAQYSSDYSYTEVYQTTDASEYVDWIVTLDKSEYFYISPYQNRRLVLSAYGNVNLTTKHCYVDDEGYKEDGTGTGESKGEKEERYKWIITDSPEGSILSTKYVSTGYLNASTTSDSVSYDLSSSAASKWILERVPDVISLQDSTRKEPISNVEKSVVLGKSRTIQHMELAVIAQRCTPSQEEIVWSSSNTDVATVDPQTGTVTGVSVGQTTISASVYLDTGRKEISYILHVIPFDTGVYTITNAGYGKVLQPGSESDDDGNALLTLGTYDAENYDQRWLLVSLENGYYKILSANGKALTLSSLDLPREATWEEYVESDGQQIQIMPYNDSSGNLFYKVRIMKSGTSKELGGYGVESITIRLRNVSGIINNCWTFASVQFETELKMYYDAGFKVRSCDNDVTKVNELMTQLVAFCNERLTNFFNNALVCTTIEYYQTLTEKCVLAQEGVIDSTTVNNGMCPDNPARMEADGVTASRCVIHGEGENCTSGKSVADHFQQDHDIPSKSGSSTVWVLFTGFKTYNVEGVTNNRSSSSGSHSLISMQKLAHSVDSAYRSSKRTLLHEISHQIGAPDHYHEILVDGSCRGKERCATCGTDPRPTWCVMDDTSAVADDAEYIYCAKCTETIYMHLMSHH